MAIPDASDTTNTEMIRLSDALAAANARVAELEARIEKAQKQKPILCVPASIANDCAHIAARGQFGAALDVARRYAQPFYATPVPPAEAKVADASVRDALDLPPFLRRKPEDAPQGKHLCECGKSYVCDNHNFTVVPTFPTSDQLIAGTKVMFSRIHGDIPNGVVGEMYRAMLAAKAKGE